MTFPITWNSYHIDICSDLLERAQVTDAVTAFADTGAANKYLND